MTTHDQRFRRIAIAEASAAVSLHPQTLRKYERAGLLRPARREGGSRHYSNEDMQRLAMIKHLNEGRGLNIAGLALALALHDEVSALLDTMSAIEPDRAPRVARERLRHILTLFEPEV